MILEKAKRSAIALLLSLPLDYPDAELSIGNIDDHLVWLGMGWLVGEGWAVYRGGFSFRLTPIGRSEVAELLTVKPPTKNPKSKRTSQVPNGERI